MQEQHLQEIANAHELPVDDSLIDLLREAILLRRRALEMELGSCRQRVEAIERRHSPPPSELAEPISSGASALSPADARLWFAELLTLQKLRASIERLSQLRLTRRGREPLFPQPGVTPGHDESIRPAA